jgi:hypothetical protein
MKHYYNRKLECLESAKLDSRSNDSNELTRLRLENEFMAQSKALSCNGELLIERLHDVVASAFRDERIYNLLDLRTMVIMAIHLAKPEFQSDLIVQDKLYQCMESIISKL